MRCMHTRRQLVRSNRQFTCITCVVSQTVVVANQDHDSRRRKANLMLNCGNTRRINFRHWRINLKPRLPKYPTCVVTKGMDLETLLQSAKRTDISTMDSRIQDSVGGRVQTQDSIIPRDFTSFRILVLDVGC
jgi:hypothetical protein